MVTRGVIAAVASFRRHTPGIDVAGRRMEEAELGLAGGSLPRLRNVRLILALWLAADQERCCEGLSIRRRSWAHLRVPLLVLLCGPQQQSQWLECRGALL